jgi:hypothetical protein
MGALSRHARFVVLAFAMLGLVAVFVLPVAEVGVGKKAEAFTVWQLRVAQTDLAYISVLGFLGAALIGGFSAARGKLQHGYAIAAALFAALGSLYFLQDLARSDLWGKKMWGTWPILILGIGAAMIAVIRALARD